MHTPIFQIIDWRPKNGGVVQWYQFVSISIFSIPLINWVSDSRKTCTHGIGHRSFYLNRVSKDSVMVMKIIYGWIYWSFFGGRLMICQNSARSINRIIIDRNNSYDFTRPKLLSVIIFYVYNKDIKNVFFFFRNDCIEVLTLNLMIRNFIFIAEHNSFSYYIFLN